MNAVAIMVPRRGMSLDEVTLVAWVVADGGRVSEGQPVCVIETDKVEMELEAPASGVLRHGGAPDGTYPPGAVIGEVMIG